MEKTDYEAGLMALEVAIREYDQAILDLTAFLVAGMSPCDDRADGGFRNALPPTLFRMGQKRSRLF